LNIAFYMENNQGRAGSAIMRMRWPALWINKFTEHFVSVYTQHDAIEEGHRDIIKKFDVLVFHKQLPPFDDIAEWTKKRFPEKVIVYDTDDLDCEADHAYLNFFMQGMETDPAKLFSHADGITVASVPLYDIFSQYKPTAVLENGFDTTLSVNQPRTDEYFNDFIKVVWGGGPSHDRDITMFLKMGVAQQLADEYDVDFYFYGVVQKERVIQHKRGTIALKLGERLDMYVERLYSDASFTIAPLINDTFNGHRSTLKLVEAGVNGKTCIASNVETYRYYPSGTITLVNNTADEWYEAIRKHIEDAQYTKARGRLNRQVVETHYSGETLAKQRIAFYQQLRAQNERIHNPFFQLGNIRGNGNTHIQNETAHSAGACANTRTC